MESAESVELSDANAMWAQRGIVFLDIKAGDYEAAEAGIESILAKYPDHNGLPKAFKWLGDDYLKVGQYDKASNCYQYVIDKQLDDRWAISSRVGIARVNISIGDDEAVDEIIDGLIADYNDHPRLPWAVFVVGEEYYYKATEAGADPNSKAEAKDYYRKAKGVWERIITEPADPNAEITKDAYYFTGVCLRRMGEWEEAVAYYQKVVDDWPNYKYAWSAQYLIGNCYEKLRASGSLPESEAKTLIEQSYKAVVEKYPDCALVENACLKLGWLNLKRGQRMEAAMYFELFLETARPTDPRIKSVKAQLEKLKGVER